MKRFSFLLLFLAGVETSYAQEEYQIPPCVIVHAGPNLSSLFHNDQFWSSNPKTGFTGGVLMRSNDNLYWMTGVNYIMANTTMTSYELHATDDVSMQFLQLPIMIGYHIAKSTDH